MTTDEHNMLETNIHDAYNSLEASESPETTFQASEISTRITKSTIKEIKDINKVVQYVKNNRSFIKIQQIEKKSLHIKVYADASYGNLHDGGSQGGLIVLLCDDQNNSSPIAWNSTRIKRVV